MPCWGGWGCEVSCGGHHQQVRKDDHGVSSRWSSIWLYSNTGLSSIQYEQNPILFRIWPLCLNPFFWSMTSWWVYGQIVFHLLKLLSSSGLHIIAAYGFIPMLGFSYVIETDPLSFSQWFVNLMGTLMFCVCFYSFFVLLPLYCVIHAREDNDSDI